jgi:DNA-binding NtrC family response regulator
MIANRKVLVVEPDQPMRETLIGMLKDRGLAAVGVANGDLAVEELATRPPYGLVITELRFKQGQTHGDDLLRVMRELGNLAPVIIFTTAIPPCFRALNGVNVFDKLRKGDPAALILKVEELAA